MSSCSEHNWEEQDWEPLLNRIDDDRCIPFLGAGANAGILPLGKELAAALAQKYHYPLADNDNLEHVSQYVALRHDREHVKDEVVRILDERYNAGKTATSCHRHLAHLPLSLFMTTNYDMLMEDALRKQKPRDPQPFVCRWNLVAENTSSASAGEKMPDPSIPKPIVFYLHGRSSDANSLVLTEDDYLEFLTRMTENADLIPQNLQTAIKNAMLLFIGYRLADWNFRILFRQLSQFKTLSSVAIFPPPADDDPSKENVESYLERYFRAMDVKIFWGKADCFAAELTNRYAQMFGRDALIGNL
jgi:hypothetical protein